MLSLFHKIHTYTIVCDPISHEISWGLRVGSNPPFQPPLGVGPMLNSPQPGLEGVDNILKFVKDSLMHDKIDHPNEVLSHSSYMSHVRIKYRCFTKDKNIILLLRCSTRPSTSPLLDHLASVGQPSRVSPTPIGRAVIHQSSWVPNRGWTPPTRISCPFWHG